MSVPDDQYCSWSRSDRSRPALSDVSFIASGRGGTAVAALQLAEGPVGLDRSGARDLETVPPVRLGGGRLHQGRAEGYWEVGGRTQDCCGVSAGGVAHAA